MRKASGRHSGKVTFPVSPAKIDWIWVAVGCGASIAQWDQSLPAPDATANVDWFPAGAGEAAWIQRH